MTVSYTEDLATSGIYGTFPTLIRWRGSLYKALYPWILIYIAIFYTISFVYEYAFDEWTQIHYFKYARLTAVYVDQMPVILMLGFYVNMCVNRWWNCYTALPDTNQAIVAANYVFRNNDANSRQKCKAFCRYVKSFWVMSLRGVAADLKKIYPDNESFVRHGLMYGFIELSTGLLAKPDLKALVDAEQDMGPGPKPWLIMLWVRRLIRHSQVVDHLNDSDAGLLASVSKGLKGNCGKITGNCATIFPLIGSQLCIFTVHTYGILSLIAKQHSNPYMKAGTPTLAVMDFYIPVFSFLPYMLYYGWLRMGEITLNPFGDDDDDINMLRAAEQNFTAADIIEQYFDNPDLLALDKVLFNETGSIRPYFHKLAENAAVKIEP